MQTLHRTLVVCFLTVALVLITRVVVLSAEEYTGGSVGTGGCHPHVR